MPTYEYECTACGHKFDELQKITDPPLKECPKCKAKLRRLITGGAGIIFKGSGFYVTDYKKSHLPMPKTNKKSLKKVEEKKDQPGKNSSESSDKKP